MKTLFVTVTEFLENGGKLELGREMFHNNKVKFVRLGDFNGKITDDYELLNITTGKRSWNVYNFDCYVQIECTPIYK